MIQTAVDPARNLVTTTAEACGSAEYASSAAETTDSPGQTLGGA